MVKYEYYFFGSENSIDEDVFIKVNETPTRQLLRDINKELKGLSKSWNIIIGKIENNIVTETVSKFGSPDDVHNCLFYTYSNHEAKQKYCNPILKSVDRNKAAKIYQSVREILELCTRTAYRVETKRAIKLGTPFCEKLKIFGSIDFETINSFNKDGLADIDIWKKIAFYLGACLALLKGNEVFTKASLITLYPELTNFINRLPISTMDKLCLNRMKVEIIGVVEELGITDLKENDLQIGNDVCKIY